MGGQFGQERAHLEGEDTAVPGIAAVRQKRLGAFQIRLFHEARHLETKVTNRLTAVEIAKAGLWRSRRDAEGDEPAILCQPGGGQGRALKGPGIGNVVIAGANQHDRLFRQAERSQRNRRRRIAGAGFHNRFAARAGRPLGFDVGEMRRSGNDDRIGKTSLRRTARQSRFEQRSIADQGQERLGHDCPTARPETRAAASA